MSDTYSQSSYPFPPSEKSYESSIGLLEQWFEIHPVFFKNSRWMNKRFADFMAALKYPKFARSDQVCVPS